MQLLPSKLLGLRPNPFLMFLVYIYTQVRGQSCTMKLIRSTYFHFIIADRFIERHGSPMLNQHKWILVKAQVLECPTGWLMAIACAFPLCSSTGKRFAEEVLVLRWKTSFFFFFFFLSFWAGLLVWTHSRKSGLLWFFSLCGKRSFMVCSTTYPACLPGVACRNFLLPWKWERNSSWQSSN